jgi:hypothetical protein
MRMVMLTVPHQTQQNGLTAAYCVSTKGPPLARMMRGLAYALFIFVGATFTALCLASAVGAQLTPCSINSSSSSVGVHECGWQTMPTPSGQVDVQGSYGSYLPVLAVVRDNGTALAGNQSAGEQCGLQLPAMLCALYAWLCKL